ncbi:MAG: cytochrome c oxidase assembly protein [Chromatiales bacterium]|jgi:cytochrome c oxidase assembly protein subunit 11
MGGSDRSRANRRVVTRLALVGVAMFGFGFALVPLYDVFCYVTGINGKTGQIELEEALGGRVDKDRTVTVEFLASVNSELPWEFRPTVKEVEVHPGAVTEVKYYARNQTDRSVTGTAVPSVAPGVAAKYFNKTECFCFTQQTLGPREARDMPLRFVVAADLPEEVKRLSLSYTFYQAGDRVAAAD